jgi:DNA-binding NarL/FixJ family response regulator
MTSTLPALAPRRHTDSVTVELHTVHAGSVSYLAQLRHRPEVELVERDHPQATVALVLAEVVDDMTIRSVRRLHTDRGLSVVLIIGQLAPQALLRLVESGVCAAIPRADATIERVVRAVQGAARRHGMGPAQVLAGRAAFDASGRDGHQRGVVARTVSQPGQGAVRAMPPIDRRERAVLELVADGRSTREIAITLSYSERTIKNVLQDLTTRLHLRNRTQAVAVAVRNGWI